MSDATDDFAWTKERAVTKGPFTVEAMLERMSKASGGIPDYAQKLLIEKGGVPAEMVAAADAAGKMVAAITKAARDTAKQNAKYDKDYEHAHNYERMRKERYDARVKRALAMVFDKRAGMSTAALMAKYNVSRARVGQIMDFGTRAMLGATARENRTRENECLNSTDHA